MNALPHNQMNARDRFDEKRIRRLLNMPHATKDELAGGLAKRLNVPFLGLSDDMSIDKAVLRTVPEQIARRFCLIPVAVTPGISVTIVMVNPMDLEALDAVQGATGLEVRKTVSSEARIEAAIDRYYSADAFVESELDLLVNSEEFSEQVSEDEIVEDTQDSGANEAPVVRFVNLVLMTALKERASDIHFEPEEHGARLRLRIDGQLQEMVPPAASMYSAIIARIKILSKMDISERRVPQDGRFKFRSGKKVIDLRVNTLPEVHGEKIVLRILDRSNLVVDLADIGFEGKMLEDFKRILALPHGIILVTGPTGSGKSTTLYGALNHVNDPAVNIQTVEDPVEYQLKGINQCAIKASVGMTFAGALRAILRQDPDIIMIGEIRDKETAEIAMRAALTGHLVLSTLHTNDATSTFSRMMDMGVEQFLISSSVKMVLAQRLVRRYCEHCKKEVPADPNQVRIISQYFDDAKDWTFYEPVGCPECGGRGYRGRCAVLEFLEVTPGVAERIKPSISAADLRAFAISDGMESLMHNGFRRVRDGITSFEEVMRVGAGEH